MSTTVNFSPLSITKYSEQLSSKAPVPGGGSAAAYAAALGAGLLSMVANYSIGRKANSRSVEARLDRSLRSSESIRKRLLELTSLDSEAYLKVVAARKKDEKQQRLAGQNAVKVGREICKLCYQAIDLAPFLVKEGNPYLLSDVQVAVELLQAGYSGSMVMVKINQ